MIAFPFCKINLGLQILNKRPDGYHTISTCFYPVLWTDVLEILPSSKLNFTQTGITIPGKAEDNLCLKAYHLLQNDFKLPPVEIHLHKVIPTGAGLGGGSSDAAFTLRILNTIFDLKISSERLAAYAVGMGSDCAFFVQDNSMMGNGRGEILKPLDINLKGYYLIILKPDVHVSTAEAYREVRPVIPKIKLEELIKLPVPEWKGQIENDFEESIFRKFPAIEEIKSEFYSQGALYAGMSGSGSSVFGIFKSKTELSSTLADVPGWSGQL